MVALKVRTGGSEWSGIIRMEGISMARENNGYAQRIVMAASIDKTRTGKQIRQRMSLRGVTVLFLIMIISFSLCPGAEAAEALQELEATNVLLVSLTEELNTKEILYDRGSEELIYPASTMKMLTALTALEIADPEEKVMVGLELFLVPYDASRAGIHIPMRLTVRELLEGMLLPSGADAAYALAAYCGRKLKDDWEYDPPKAIARFVEAMNHKAASLGAEHTTAVNVDGYDAQGQMSTAQDILVIAQAFLKQPVLAEICAMPEAVLESEMGTTVKVRNSNELLHKDSGYYIKDAVGIKTGTTTKAGNCLVSSFEIQGNQYVCIVMNSSYYGRYADTRKLYEICCAKSSPAPDQAA